MGRSTQVNDFLSRQTHDLDAVVSLYDGYDHLLPVEQHVFAQFIRPGMRILDLGVGGGRTTSTLAAAAARYVGLDLSERMVEVCRRRFPRLEFVVGDAADLSRFPAGSFDAVVFSYNGIDLLPPDARRRCLSECARVLSPAGVLILSRTNPRALLYRAAPPDVRPPRTGAAKASAALRRSLVHAARQLSDGAFWRGHGPHRVPNILPFWGSPAQLRAAAAAAPRARGPLYPRGYAVVQAATPASAVREFRQQGFGVLAVAGAGYPQQLTVWSTYSYYYVLAPLAPGDGLQAR